MELALDLLRQWSQATLTFQHQLRRDSAIDATDTRTFTEADAGDDITLVTADNLPEALKPRQRPAAFETAVFIHLFKKINNFWQLLLHNRAILNQSASRDNNSYISTSSAGVFRNRVCRAYHTQMLDIESQF
jgi:hypothetical protein